MLVFLKVGCACYCCCIDFFECLAVGGYFTDFVANLRFYCEVKGCALFYAAVALEGCCADRIYGVIYVVLTIYCCFANQIFCFYNISSCICAAPDGYGVVCLTT